MGKEKEKILNEWAKYLKVKLPKKILKDIATALEIQEIYENYERVLRGKEPFMIDAKSDYTKIKDVGKIIPYIQN